jgi:glutaryl-CoA dehydrogenase
MKEKLHQQQVSMAKRNACEVATNICRDARQMLGGMGITGEYHYAPHDEPGKCNHL